MVTTFTLKTAAGGEINNIYGLISAGLQYLWCITHEDATILH